ncbi:MAG: hypothetical protein V4662_27615 [Verrucomicrobiota bacterium]
MKTLLKAALAALLLMSTRSEAQIDTLLITPTWRDASTLAQDVAVSLPIKDQEGFPPQPREVQSQWIKSKGYHSENITLFQAEARATLADLKKQIDVVAAWAGPNTPKFMQTRLLSLRQQHEHLTVLLKAQTTQTLRSPMSGPRHAFDKAVSLLERNIDQANDEIDRVQEIVNPGVGSNGS